MFDFLNLGVYLTAQIRVFKCQLLDGKIFILLSIVLSTDRIHRILSRREEPLKEQGNKFSIHGREFIYFVLCLKQTPFLPTFWKLFPHHNYIVHVEWNLLSSLCRPNSSSHAKCHTCRRSDFSQIGDP